MAYQKGSSKVAIPEELKDNDEDIIDFMIDEICEAHGQSRERVMNEYTEYDFHVMKTRKFLQNEREKLMLPNQE